MMRRRTFDQNLRRNKNLSGQRRLTGEWIQLTEDQFQDLITMTFANCLKALPDSEGKKLE
jgi:hypothetical protein